MSKKHRQHHVWQHYLGSWTVDDKLHCLMNGRVFVTGTISVAVDRHFYKLPRLNAEDIKNLRWLIVDGSNPIAKKTHESFLAQLTFPIGLVDMLKASGKDVTAIEAHLEEYLINILENYHGTIEETFAPVLERLKHGDTSFYPNDEEGMAFLLFLCVQFLRTKGVKTRALQNVKQNNGLDLTRIWDIMSLMLAVDVAAKLFAGRNWRRLELVRNNTGTHFITGDQPVVNLHAPEDASTEHFSLYYPLSPKLALILAEENSPPFVTTETLTAERALDLNTRVFDASHQQTFAKDYDALVPFIGR